MRVLREECQKRREDREADTHMLSAYNRYALDVMKNVEVTYTGLMHSALDLRFPRKHIARLEAQDAETSIALE